MSEQESSEINTSTFREEVREWLSENFPTSLQGQGIGDEGDKKDFKEWRLKLANKGWGAPTWPTEYGGGGLTQTEARIIDDEMIAAGAFNPISGLSGMGITMVGPTILEYGTEDQKNRHLPGIASGEIRWCLGLSEPNAGSDLASLSTKAEDDGDSYLINGQKIWTSGANISQWCGALVRTDSKAGKRDGISFVLLPMDQAGVETRPIKLIAGASPFCETYFNDAAADKKDLLGNLNDGWSVIKRLLQHERQSQTGSRSAGTASKPEPIQDMALRYAGADEKGRLADPDLRGRIANYLMDASAHSLTIARITAEAKGNVNVSAAASILKNSATQVAQTKAELTVELMGTQGLGWEGNDFTQQELGHVREWLSGKAMSIYGGSFEVQNNIISKNILGLPETTQKG
ncbi:MAG: acyl-CoA dehydrogenase [Gammaproteobacteria bacterium]|nr:acyl-CoA dehydrogenase [Gammaproteobacteria bacterium]MCH2351353.1 acyl-CoA dehydrogenase family protein [Pseudomonadales bacterium]HAO54973.1 acyl-CoA dehydrogenase [Gammaproteobacteria bacterium]|tara:strand:- start:4150 stop:5361 length:1212 start_codon:yes stop_codon:yes gene_type:complete